MADHPPFEIPDKLERCLAALSKTYAKDGKRTLQAIVVNAQIRVNEAAAYQGYMPGHTLHLTVPESIYLDATAQRARLQKQIAGDLNEIHHVRDEFVHEVLLEMDVPADSDWRQESGLLVAGARQVSQEGVKRIWTNGDFRLFLSHKAEVKKAAGGLKDVLHYYGVSAFVAHTDIHPTKAWQDEIENALATMDGFAALMTADFHDSDWTDQEVGYALARGVPMIAVRLERDPYGFLGKLQALTCDWDAAPAEIVKILIKNDRMVSAYLNALRNCPSFDIGNALSRILPAIPALSEQQANEVIDAFNANGELQGSFGFSGTKPGA